MAGPMGRAGSCGLIVATSKVIGASAASVFGGAGIGNAVSAVARARVNGVDPGPWVNVPTIELLAGRSSPWQATPATAAARLTAPPCTVIAGGIGCGA